MMMMMMMNVFFPVFFWLMVSDLKDLGAEVQPAQWVLWHRHRDELKPSQ